VSIERDVKVIEKGVELLAARLIACGIGSGSRGGMQFPAIMRTTLIGLIRDRFAELRRAGEPGHELQADTGWVLSLEPDDAFTPNVSRCRFVYPIERETTVEAIAAFEAAWAFYGGSPASRSARCGTPASYDSVC
jgi:hypothetical protein